MALMALVANVAETGKAEGRIAEPGEVIGRVSVLAIAYGALQALNAEIADRRH